MDTQVTVVHLEKIARFLPKWKAVAQQLGLEDEEVKDIEDRYNNREEQRSEVLRKWVEKEGPQATYRRIYDILCQLEKRDAAERVKSLTRGNPRCSDDDAAEKVKSSTRGNPRCSDDDAAEKVKSSTRGNPRCSDDDAAEEVKSLTRENSTITVYLKDVCKWTQVMSTTALGIIIAMASVFCFPYISHHINGFPEAIPPAILDHDLISGSSVVVPLAVKRYSDYLKAVYNMTQVGGDQWSPVWTQHYIKLLAVEKMKNMSKKEDEMFTMARMYSKMEEVKEMKKMKKPINVEQIGTLSDGERTRCITVEGIPGIGKSTLSWHLGVSWAQEKILCDYHLVVLLRLRDERVKNAKCVNDLFYHSNETIRNIVAEWVSSLEGEGVLLILDGYDELPSGLQTSSIFADIIKGEVLPKMTVLVTSRPSANQNLQDLFGSQKCQYIEVIGFGKEEIQKYVDHDLYYDIELRDELKKYLEYHPHIQGLMYIPLNCAIIVQVFRDEKVKTSQRPETMTEVYQVLIKTLLKRHEKKHNSASTTSNEPSRLSGVSENTTSQLLVLAKLAYDGIERDELIFQLSSGTMETLGLLQEVPQLYLDSNGSSSYNFLHKTVQEFMAALYISSLPSYERAQIVNTIAFASKMKIVMRFVAGLTKLQSENDLVAFSNMTGKEELMETFHWLFEAHDPNLVQRLMGDREELDLHRTDTGTFGSALDPLDCYVLGYCIAKSNKTWELNHEYEHKAINGECLMMLMMAENRKAFDYITSFHLGCYDHQRLRDQGGILGEMLRNNNVLTSLKLNHCGLSPVAWRKLCCALEENTALTSLDLSVNYLAELCATSLGELLRKNKVLTSLKLRACSLGPNSLHSVFSALEENTALTSLELSDHHTFDEQSATSLGEMLRKNKVLTSLELYNCNLSSEDQCKVFTALEENTALTSLDLSENIFNELSATSLGKMLRKNKILTSLQLRNCRLSPEVMCKVCSALENTTLTSLDLSHNTFDEKTATCLAHLLNSNHTLKRLRLSECGLNDDTILLLVKGLEHSILEELDHMSNDFIGSTECCQLMGALKKRHPTLKVIGLWHCIEMRDF